MLNIVMNPGGLSRRNFIKLLGLGLTSFSVRPGFRFNDIVDFPNYERLGRVCRTDRVDIKSAPSESSQTVGVLYPDDVIPWIKEVVSKEPVYTFYNQRWVETVNGFVYSVNIQPVKNIPNKPINTLPSNSLGEGMWMEVTIPYADITLQNDPTSNSWVSARINDGLPLRIYYGQVFYVDKIKIDEDGKYFYRINPNYYGGLDMFWVSAEAMHPVTIDELLPINSEIENKKILIDLSRQTLSCFEGDVEVYFCRVSTGGKWDSQGNMVDKWSTPIGSYLISRKYISLQMSGGTTGAPYDLPGIGWVSIFGAGGVAIHATVWHNAFGDPMSHGCVNTLPQDAKWIFRWSLPNIPYDPGQIDITETGDNSTTVQVVES
jgi:lipoprotein-anchoring transpeptidase ErfK/SrfK